MSTRSHIAVKESGRYTYIYNHFDSDVSGLGIMLYRYYNTEEKAKALVALGDTISVCGTIENTATSYKDHMARPFEQRGTVAFFRDGSRWKDMENPGSWDECCKPRKTNCLQELIGKDVKDVPYVPFIYIFDVEKKEWLVACYADEYKLHVLEEVLHSRELLEELFGDMYREEVKNKVFENCLNAKTEN